MISIIVPVYNSEKHLEQCVNSILNQCYKNIELILVDDGSTDSSPSICDRFATTDNRVKVIHKNNGGPSSARNLALKEAKGDYISFVDSDDWVEDNMYSNLINLIQLYNADLAVCGMVDIYSDGKFTEHLVAIEDTVISGYEALTDRLSGTLTLTDSPCNKLYKREIFNNLTFPEDRSISEDTAIMYIVFDKAERIAVTKKIGYNVRCVPTSSSRASYSSRKCASIKTYTEMADFLASKENYRHLIPFAKAFIAGAIFYNAGEMYSVNFPQKKETVKYVKNSAKELLLSKNLLSVKNRILLLVITISPSIFGFIYKLNKTKK